MPIYEYQHEGEPGPECKPRFELLQSISEPPLVACPTCGKPCHRVFSAFSPGRGPGGDILSRKNLERHGFTQYTRAGDGVYERTAGNQGPPVIGAD